jgi:hypothetical protein
MARCFALATNLAKENEPKENPMDFPNTQSKQCVIHVVCAQHGHLLAYVKVGY